MQSAPQKARIIGEWMTGVVQGVVQVSICRTVTPDPLRQEAVQESGDATAGEEEHRETWQL